ncbi:MAG: hypothetical protein UHN47_03635 [Lachnospiraceae bacterium]|nr:hypothetical protein [Lachnospiraceae bacterium]
MREKDQSRLKKIWIAIMAIALVCLVLVTMLERAKITNSLQQQEAQGNTTEENNSNSANDYSYETCYAGKPYLPERLFSVPFQKTDDYIMNKELVKQLGTENTEMVAERAKSIFVPLFNIVHKDTDNMDTLRTLMQENMTKGFSLILGEDNVVYGREACSDRIIKWAMDNGISMEASMQTDKCMVYYDQNALIVRGMLTFTITECDSIEELRNAYGMENMQLGKDYSVIVEVHMVPDEDKTDYESYNMATFEIMQ